LLNGSEWTALAAALPATALLIIARLRYASIPRLTARGGDTIPDCMAIIPARNEQSVIGRAVKSLPPDTVIVVDDHSGDATAEVARKAGAGVLPAPDLPRGAVGKANACSAGARVLTSTWILFADADTWFEPGFLNAAVAAAEEGKLAFVSFYLRPEWQTWKDGFLFPFAQALFFCGVRPKSGAPSIFNGQCVLVRRDAYEFIGDHGAILNTLTDDVKLAALARRHRMSVASFRAEDLGHVLYRDPRGTVVRGAFRFLALSSWMGIGVITAAVASVLWLPMSVWLSVDAHPAEAVALAILPAILTLPWYRGVRAILAPFAAYAILPALSAGVAAALTGGRVEWKGRTL
jgi:hypothetical protein